MALRQTFGGKPDSVRLVHGHDFHHRGVMSTDIARRRLMFALGGAALWPLAAHAQSSDRVRRIGVLPTGYRESDPEGQARVNALRESLGKLGWTDGRNA